MRLRYAASMKRLPLLSVVLVLSAALAGCSPSVSRDGTQIANRASPTASANPTPSERTAAESSAAPPRFQRVHVSDECDEPFKRAVRLGRHDFYFKLAAWVCSSPDEWASGVYAHSDGLGLLSLGDEDVRVALETTCYEYVMWEALPCVQAVDRGLFNAPPMWPES